MKRGPSQWNTQLRQLREESVKKRMYRIRGKNGPWQVSNLCSEGYALTPCATRKITIMVRVLHRYRRAQGSNPGKPGQFFRLSCRSCISCDVPLRWSSLYFDIDSNAAQLKQTTWPEYFVAHIPWIKPDSRNPFSSHSSSKKEYWTNNICKKWKETNIKLSTS